MNPVFWQLLCITDRAKLLRRSSSKYFLQTPDPPSIKSKNEPLILKEKMYPLPIFTERSL